MRGEGRAGSAGKGTMDHVNQTLFIPLYGKARVSGQNIILRAPKAEEIWEKEAFPVRGKSASKWLAYNMAMRARVFDDWTEAMLRKDQAALVLHIGCGLDSRCIRVKEPYAEWIDIDMPAVIEQRRLYFEETASYKMVAADATKPEEIKRLPDAECVIVVLEGLSMYLTNRQLKDLFRTFDEKYHEIHILMDVYTDFAARASKYKNPVNEVGVTELYGLDDPASLTVGTRLVLKGEHSFTPGRLVNELPGADRLFFNALFTGKLYGKLYRLYEFEAAASAG